ncbi:DNA-binding transcriptional regulator, MarR family [Oceanobacillus limi]|uniref:DNA-binding transcriptional regulator, MarR family n=1 Tax=Oceanobacillus limi TaxID=930131 RepID=A0A1H9YGN2_9BACI|nr:MarR family transcriptional regulator [Oceanobacillus limi]SES68180.1 DNA-binding transcriptional regulator, MarR family [Oceanobacillus limi]
MNLKEMVDRHQTAMNSIYRRVNIILKEKIHSDITTDQFSTLNYIRKHDRCTSSDIAHEFGIGKSAVTAQINRLFDKELIERKRDDKDRRVVYLIVTEKGIEFVNFTEKALHEELEKYLKDFSQDEISMFINLLERLSNNMEDK